MFRTTIFRRMVKVKDYNHLCSTAAQKILEISQAKIQEQGSCAIALSGGTTPQGLYACMATPAYQEQFDWKKTHFFLVDERWVPLDSPKSNYNMIVSSGIPASNIHRVPTAPNAQKAAQLYENQLREYFHLQQGQFPRFDFILLGLGQDGHTASIFPNHSVLKEEERLAVAVEAAGVPEKRITLTLPVINHAHAVIFLVSGPTKAAILKRVFEEKSSLPAAKVNPSQGEMWWFMDQTAGSLLKKKYYPIA